MWVAGAKCLVEGLGWVEGAGVGRLWGAGGVPPIGFGGQGVLLVGVAIAERFGQAAVEAAGQKATGGETKNKIGKSKVVWEWRSEQVSVKAATKRATIAFQAEIKGTQRGGTRRSSQVCGHMIYVNRTLRRV